MRAALPQQLGQVKKQTSDPHSVESKKQFGFDSLTFEKHFGFAGGGLVCLVATMRSQLVWAATGSLITLLITWIIPDQRVPPVVVAPAAGGELEASRGRVCMTNDELTVSLKFLCMPCDASLCVSWVCCVRMPACHRSNRARGWPLCQTACVLRVSAAVGSRCCFVRSGQACHLGVVVCALFQQSCQPQLLQPECALQPWAG
jgi:hypothetical protein